MTRSSFLISTVLNTYSFILCSVRVILNMRRQIRISEASSRSSYVCISNPGHFVSLYAALQPLELAYCSGIGLHYCHHQHYSLLIRAISGLFECILCTANTAPAVVALTRSTQPSIPPG